MDIYELQRPGSGSMSIIPKHKIELATDDGFKHAAAAE